MSLSEQQQDEVHKSVLLTVVISRGGIEIDRIPFSDSLEDLSLLVVILTKVAVVDGDLVRGRVMKDHERKDNATDQNDSSSELFDREKQEGIGISFSPD